MSRVRVWGPSAAFGVVVLLTPWATPPAFSQPAIKINININRKPEPLAETRLLMNGFATPNFRGLGKQLKDRPKDAETWEFARGQALLIGETANLLLLRPPKADKAAQDLWASRAGDLRDAAAALGRSAGAKDFLKARTGLVDLANACNRCHQSFKVAARVAPFADDE